METGKFLLPTLFYFYFCVFSGIFCSNFDVDSDSLPPRAYPQYIPVSPCSCNLQPNQCDVYCCCDPVYQKRNFPPHFFRIHCFFKDAAETDVSAQGRPSSSGAGTPSPTPMPLLISKPLPTVFILQPAQ